MVLACLLAAGGRNITASRSGFSLVEPSSPFIIDPASAGAVFDGVGGASGGGGGTRLLVDYPEQIRSDILDVLFKPQFGLSLQHCKVEVGCDGDTTQGSEPTHARSETDVSFDRGYEVWLMEEASKRRPEIGLSGLEWGIPGWVASKGGMWSKSNQEYLVGWVSGLLKTKGLNITALAVSYNERGYNDAFMKDMRKSLDAAGLSHVKTIGGDQCGSSTWKLVDDMKKDKELADSIDIIGVHNPGPITHAASMPAGTLELKKPIWGTEQHIGENGLGGNVPDTTDPDQKTDLPVWDWHAALGLAKALNQGWLTANQTAVLIWTPTYSWYEYVCLSGKGMVVANTPWSGHYSIPDAVWTVAHTSQFVQPGWRFLHGPGASTFLPDNRGSMVAYTSPNGAELSIVIESGFSNASNAVRLQLAGRFATLRSVHFWRSNASAVFVQQPPLLLEAGGMLNLVIPAGEVWTLTTTTGQQKGSDSLTIPPAANFSLPYSDDFDQVAMDATPKYTSDMHGVFTASASEGIAGKVLRQQTASEPQCTHCGSSSAFGTILGDGSWLDYSVEVAARVIGTADKLRGGGGGGGGRHQQLGGGGGGDAPPFVFLGSHLGVFSSGSLGTNGLWPYYVHSSRHPPGFMLTVYFDKNPKGEWFLQAGQASKDMDQRCHTGGHTEDVNGFQRESGGRGNDCAMVLAGNGTLDSGVGQWLHLKLSAKRMGNGSTVLTAAIDGVLVVKHLILTAPQARGAVSLGCGLHHAEYDNLTVTPT
eukprot:COSAG02_NODE_6073_length_3821_cov_18.905159_2_plen_760_part_00